MPQALGTVVRGIYGTSDLFSEQRKNDKDKSKQFIWRERGYATLSHMLVTMVPKMAVSDPEPKHFEDGYRILKVALTGLTISALSGTTPEQRTITFSTSAASAQYVGLFVVGQTWENDSIFMHNTANPTTSLTRAAGGVFYSKRETMVVVSVNIGTGDVVFTRHLGTTTMLGTSVAPATTHTLHLHATTNGDGSGSPVSTAQNPVVVNNFIEIFKEPYEQTEVAQKTDIFGENEWQRKARNARRNFARQLERAFIGGHMYKDIDPVTLKDRWWTGGIEDWCPADVDHQIALNKAPTPTFMNSLFKDAFMFGSNEKYFVIGYDAATKISNGGIDKIRFNDSLSANLGMDVFDYTTAGGGIVHMCPDFEMSNTGRDSEGFLVDLAYLQYMYLQGSDIQIDKGPNGTGLQLPAEKKTVNQIYGMVGLKRTFADSHFHYTDFA